MNGQFCPSCGTENHPDAFYCSICGTELSFAGMGRKGRLLFFSTPLILLLIGISFAFDLGIKNPVETGTIIGIYFLVLPYLISGISVWIFCFSFQIYFRPTTPWRAGIFSILQLFATILLSLPLQLYLIPENLSKLTLTEEEEVRNGLLLAIYLPLTLLGLAMMLTNDQKFKPNKNFSNYSTENTRPSLWILRWQAISKFGAIPIFICSLVISLFLTITLPDYKKDYLLGRIAINLQMTEFALSKLNSSIDKKLDNPPALHLRGLLKLSNNNPEIIKDGIKDIETALKLSPTNTRYRISLAIALDQVGQTEEAINTASQAVDLKPFDPALWTALADLKLKKNDREGAIFAYKKALQLNPDDPRNLNNLAYTLLELNQELGTALEMAKKSVEKLPNQLFNLDTLAWALYKNEQIGEAYQIMLQIRETIATLPLEIEFHYAAIAHKMGMLHNPRETFEKLWEKADEQKDFHLKNEIAKYIASLGVTLKKFDTIQNEKNTLATVTHEIATYTPQINENKDDIK